jgi:hypothetical protein
VIPGVTARDGASARVRGLPVVKGMTGNGAGWEKERRSLLGRRISDLGLSIEGSPLQPLVEALYGELRAKGLVFRPPVYLSDQWGCPSGVPLIGVPFYLADARLARIEEEHAVEVEGAADAMKYLRHEAGHAYNYAYRLYDRADWRATFGPYSRPYRERFHADPFTRDHVRHILAWYAQKHPDEDFAESFAVWVTPGLDWRRQYDGWGALRKLEYVDRVMAEVGGEAPEAPVPRAEHLPVSAMHYTVAEHYTEAETGVPIPDERHFDGDLRTIFPGGKSGDGGRAGPDDGGTSGDPAAAFIRDHRREVVRRIAYWTGEPSTVVRAFVDFLAERAEALGLRVGALESSTLIELVAFGTAVLMNYRHTDALGGVGSGRAP